MLCGKFGGSFTSTEHCLLREFYNASKKTKPIYTFSLEKEVFEETVPWNGKRDNTVQKK